MKKLVFLVMILSIGIFLYASAYNVSNFRILYSYNPEVEPISYSFKSCYNISDFHILYSYNPGVEPIENVSISSYSLSRWGILRTSPGGNGVDVAYSGTGFLSSLLTRLSGFVMNRDTEEVLESATVILAKPGYEQTVNSDTLGFFSFIDIDEGNFSLMADLDGYFQYNEPITIEEGINEHNIELTEIAENELPINSSLTAYAEEIEETSTDVFSLSGEVNINGLLFFGGDIMIDKRAILNYPTVTGSSSYSVINNGSNQTIKSGGTGFSFHASDSRLIPFNNIYNDLSPLVGGFNIKCGIINFQSVHLQVGFQAELPYPIEPVFAYINQNHSGYLPLYLEGICGSIKYYPQSSAEIEFNLEDLSANFGIFAINNLNVYFDTSEDVFGGGFKLKIPGIPENLRGETEEDFSNLKVTIVDDHGNYQNEISMEKLVEMQRLLGADFLELGLEMEFISGALNTLVISIGSQIPIGSTGLFITEMAGGVEDLQSDNWKILASVDISTGLVVPVLGTAVKLDDVAARIHPVNYFHGSGGIEVFKYPLSGGMIEYDGRKKAFKTQGNIAMGGILSGKIYSSVKSNSFIGGSAMKITTPADLPFLLKWAQNITLGSAEVSINNLVMESECSIIGLTLAQQFEFGLNEIPWFHYSIGRNLKRLTQIWRGERNGRQVITFQVPENSGQLLVVAGNDQYLFDYELQAPDGTIYDESNCSYNQFDSSQQTVVVIDNPQAGEWDFITEVEGDIITEFRCLDQQPTTLVSQPEERGMRNNTVSLSFNDYSDTLSVQVYYDTDNRHYNGVKIQEFELLNNSELEFEWFNDDVPDGEYFIYTRISDGQNAPVLQYAPGSIIVDNVILESPQSFNAVQNGESVEVSWDEPSGDLYLTTVYYEDLSTGMLDMKSVAGVTEAVITGLTEGHPYKFYAVFVDGEYNESEPSETVDLVYYSAQRNNPPYFLMDDEIVYDFIADEYSEIEILAEDADNDNLSFSVLDNENGLNISGNILNWTPLHENRGVHLMKIVASDGALADTTTVQISVLTQQQAAVQLKFNSPNLFEEDNMYVKLKNFRCDDLTQAVTLQNMVTGDSEELELRKVNKFDYIGKFELSFRNRTMLWVANGDTIKAGYSYDGNTYQAYAVYDSLAQYSDDIAPDAVSDLEADLNAEDEIILNWTATGDDGSNGIAYHYDIRYGGEPILCEDDWLWASQIECDLYPAEAGEPEEFSFNISQLENIAAYDSLFFMIKVEDEMQNWSDMSNNAALRFLLPPADVNALLSDDFCTQLTWTGSETRRQSRQEVEFLYYNIYRRKDDGVLLPLVSEITSTNYTDTLFWQPDGNYTYAVQSVYNSGNSSRTESNPIELERFTDLRILCTLSDTTNYEGIEFSLTGLDSIYTQTFTDTTNLFGLLLLADVYKTEYLVELYKADYRPYTDTLNIDDSNNIFDFELQKLLFGDIDLNGIVESFDASLVLQYFTEIQEIPEAPRPWQEWLIIHADVDGNGAVEAYDAALILRYVIGWIEQFPAEE